MNYKRHRPVETNKTSAGPRVSIRSDQKCGIGYEKCGKNVAKLAKNVAKNVAFFKTIKIQIKINLKIFILYISLLFYIQIWPRSEKFYSKMAA